MNKWRITRFLFDVLLSVIFENIFLIFGHHTKVIKLK